MTTIKRPTPKLVNAFAKNSNNATSLSIISNSRSFDSNDISHISTIHSSFSSHHSNKPIPTSSRSFHGPPPGWPASKTAVNKSETSICSPCKLFCHFVTDCFSCKVCCRGDAYNARNVKPSNMNGISNMNSPLSPSDSNIKLLLIGLDNAGKTSLALHLSGESIEDVVSTIGFSNYELSIDRFLNLLPNGDQSLANLAQNWRISLYDLGGGARIRQIWKNYYALVHGIIFVIDAADLERLDEFKESLESVLKDPFVAGKPILIYLNKQDRPQTMDETEFNKVFRVTALALENGCQIKTESISVRNVYFRSIFSSVNTGNHTHHDGDGHCLDPEIGKSFRWMLEQIINNWPMLNTRVETDTEEQIKREKSLMAERLQRLKANKKKSLIEEDSESDKGTVIQYEPKSSSLLVPPPLSPISERSSTLTNEDAISGNNSSSAQNINNDEVNFVNVTEKAEQAKELEKIKRDKGKNRPEDDEEKHISSEKLNRIIRKGESLWDEHGKSENFMNRAALESMEVAIIPPTSASSLNRPSRKNKVYPSP